MRVLLKNPTLCFEYQIHKQLGKTILLLNLNCCFSDLGAMYCTWYIVTVKEQLIPTGTSVSASVQRVSLTVSRSGIFITVQVPSDDGTFLSPAAMNCSQRFTMSPKKRKWGCHHRWFMMTQALLLSLSGSLQERWGRVSDCKNICSKKVDNKEGIGWKKENNGK